MSFWKEKIQALDSSSLNFWIQKSGLAVIDQAASSGTVFFLHFMLARWLTQIEYGSFAVAYSIFILVQAIHMGLIIEPMIIFGSGKYRNNLANYITVVIYGHLILAFITGTIIVVFALLLPIKQLPLRYALVGMGISNPFILLFHLVRRSYYIKLDLKKPTIFSLIYFIGMIFMIAGFYVLNILSSFSAFLCLSISALISALISMKYTAYGFARIKDNISIREIMKEHYYYGRWASGTLLLNWIPGNIYYMVLPFFVGLQGTATLRALINFVLPIQHVIGALNFIFLPVISKDFAEKNFEGIDSKVSQYTKIILVTTLGYWIVLGSFGDILIGLVYKGKYLNYGWLFWFIGLLPLLSSFAMPRYSTLLAVERPDKVFFAYLLTAISTLTIGIFLTAYLKLNGSVAGLLISTFLNCVFVFLIYERHLKIMKAS